MCEQGRTWTENIGGAKKIRHYRKRKIYPNNLVKQKTIYEITTNTTYIQKKEHKQTRKFLLKKINKLTNYIKTPQNFYSQKKGL
jgi:hypothetical protein